MASRLFDVDGTLIARNSATLYMQHLRAHGPGPPAGHRADPLLPRAATSSGSSTSSGRSTVSMALRARQATRRRVRDDCAGVVRERRSGRSSYPGDGGGASRRTAARATCRRSSTSATRYLAEPLAADLGIAHRLVTQLVVRDGRSRARRSVRCATGAGKTYWAERFASRERLSTSPELLLHRFDHRPPVLERGRRAADRESRPATLPVARPSRAGRDLRPRLRDAPAGATERIRSIATRRGGHMSGTATPDRRAEGLIGPLALLAGGAVTGMGLWYLLMLERPDAGVGRSRGRGAARRPRPGGARPAAAAHAALITSRLAEWCGDDRRRSCGGCRRRASRPRSRSSAASCSTTARSTASSSSSEVRRLLPQRAPARSSARCSRSRSAASPSTSSRSSETLKAAGELQPTSAARRTSRSSPSASRPAANVVHYARIVRDRSILLRNLIGAGHRASRPSGYEADGDVAELLDQRRAARSSTSPERRIRASFSSIGEVLVGSLKTIERLYEQKQAGHRRADGLRRPGPHHRGPRSASDLIIIAGRPSMGKCLTADAEIVLADGQHPTIEEIARARAGRLLTLGDRWQFAPAEPSAFVDDGIKPASTR